MTIDEGIPSVTAPSPGTRDRARKDVAEQAVPLPLAVRDVVARLTAAWPAVTETTVEALVASAFDSFRQAKVRAYVPILVERRVRRVLGAICSDTPPGRHDDEERE
ncbi:three-helix bundle dimerization domain-containing protein [Streptomyces canus]|uniref:three-helix bundle dimerization domain-containing protein n=1 Tax=Streptomyces canus TaxID=58343 RepID=UPI00369BE219